MSIKLKKDIVEADIKILFNDEELSFKKDGKDILVQVTENGMYTIITNDYKTSFKISNIDEYAPELVEVVSGNGELVLVINDEASQIDYGNSFMEYQGKKYKIPRNLKIKGEFNGIIKVTIFDCNGHWIKYNLNIE
ncbi:MAG: hypothetical protein ACK5LC_16165 [Coprobacillaceae bacterium]